MEIKKRLLMTFLTDGDKKVSIGVDDPRPDLTEAEVIEVMDAILTNDAFSPKGEAFVAAVGTKVVETVTTPIRVYKYKLILYIFIINFIFIYKTIDTRIHLVYNPWYYLILAVSMGCIYGI